MPIVFLSPSTQDWNPYVTGSGSEEYWMNQIADAMEPYLRSNGIRFRRNDPDTSAAAAIREANSGYYDFYPLPDQVTTHPTTALGEVSRSRFPAVLVEIGYHDNYSDALWLESHVEDVARQLVKALTEYFGLPFIPPMDPKRGTVRLSYGTLNLRSTPSPAGTVIANLPNGAEVTVYGEWNGWYVVQYGDQVGYAAAAYIDV